MRQCLRCFSGVGNFGHAILLKTGQNIIIMIIKINKLKNLLISFIILRRTIQRQLLLVVASSKQIEYVSES